MHRWGDLNTQLHDLLLGRADRPRMRAMARQLLQSTDRFTRMQLVYTDGRARAEQEHGEIVRLCEEGQFRPRLQCLRAHIENAGDSLVKHLRKKKTNAPGEAS